MNSLPLIVLAVVLWSGTAVGAVPPYVAMDNGILDVRVRNEVSHNEIGRFNLGALPNVRLLSGWPHAPGSAFTTVRIGGQNLVFGDRSTGTVTQMPAVAGGALTTRWTAVGIAVEQELTFVPNPAAPGGPANTLRIRYGATNNAGGTVSVGLRLLLDPAVAGREDGPASLDGGASTTKTETCRPAPASSDAIRFYERTGGPAGAVLTLLQGTGAPNSICVGNMSFYPPFAGLRHSLWAYGATPRPAPVFNLGAAVFWDPQPLGVGQSITWTAHYGLPAPGQAAMNQVASRRRMLSDEDRDRDQVRADDLGTAAVGPNPARRQDGFIWVRSPAEGPGAARKIFSLYDVSGQLRLRISLMGESGTVVPIGMLARGIYVYRVSSPDPAAAARREPQDRVRMGTLAVVD